MEAKRKRVADSGGSAHFDDQLARTQLLTDCYRNGTNARWCRAAHPETEESPGGKDTVFEYELSPWTRSSAKRVMDVGIVLAFSPILFPLLAAIALAVLLTSGRPVLFRQVRVGLNGIPFAILKFRTMRPALVHPLSSIAIASASRITWLGAFLRRSKLDELPQIFNVLAGEMSLVGPRPKVPVQQPVPLPCRPGLTGAATLAFAREEMLLQGIASADLDEYYHKTILSVKRDLDADYLRRATVWADLWILVNTVLGRWESHTRATCWLQDEESRLETSDQTASLSQ